jgi:hypothetical protein
MDAFLQDVVKFKHPPCNRSGAIIAGGAVQGPELVKLAALFYLPYTNPILSLSISDFSRSRNFHTNAPPLRTFSSVHGKVIGLLRL